jgi:hypothetical protein
MKNSFNGYDCGVLVTKENGGGQDYHYTSVIARSPEEARKILHERYKFAYSCIVLYTNFIVEKYKWRPHGIPYKST